MKKIFTLCVMSVAMVVATHAQIAFKKGTVAPDFTFVDESGKTQTLYQYCNAGKYVLIDFFAYWCDPCHSTAVLLDQFYKKYGCNAYNVAVLGIEDQGTVAQLVQFHKDCKPPVVNSYPTANGLAPGNGAAPAKLYGIGSSYPQLAIIGPDKKVFDDNPWPNNPNGLTTLAEVEAFFVGVTLTPKVCSTGVSEVTSESSVSIYPSPASNSITIDLNNVASITSLKLYNVLGNTIISQEVKSFGKYELNISQLETGIYFMQVDTDNGVVMKKFMKK